MSERADTTTRVCPSCGYVFSSTAEPGEPIRKPDVQIRERQNSDMLQRLAEHTSRYAAHNRQLEVDQRDSDRHKLIRT